MAEFGDMKLTNKGRDMIAASIAGTATKFSKAVAGGGVLPEGQDITEMTGLINPIRDLQIRATYAPEGVGRATVKTKMTNAGLERFFLLREIGLFAPDPETGEDVLYGYCNAGDKWTHIAAQDGPDVVSYHFDLNVQVGQAAVLSLLVGDPLNVTLPELEEYLGMVLKDVKAREDRLQKQIDQLAEASIIKSLGYAERQLKQVEEAK